MRVFQLNTYCGVKSTGRIACEIAKLITEEGGECRIGYGVPGISEDGKEYAVKIGTKLERKIHAVLRKLFDAEGYGSWFATRKLLHQMKGFRPDLIHLHNIHGCYLHIPMLFRYLRRADIPVVWTLHDCWPFTGHCAYFDYAACEKWKTGCSHCPQKKSYPVCVGLDGSKRNYRMKRKFFNFPRQLTFVVPCEWMTLHLRQSHLKHYPYRVIYNGINPDVFHPVESDIRQRYHLEGIKICLAVAAEWDHRKGLSFLCDASKRMGEHYAFVVIGLTAEQINKLPDGMIGIQSTADTKELAAWYTTADCLVNPTMEDNMPMVNLESLACGTPVVVFETGGCPEAVDDTCGIVVPKGDLNAFCDSIQRAMECDFSSENCLKRARAFDCKVTFGSYLALYKELSR